MASIIVWLEWYVCVLLHYECVSSSSSWLFHLPLHYDELFIYSLLFHFNKGTNRTQCKWRREQKNLSMIERETGRMWSHSHTHRQTPLFRSRQIIAISSLVGFGRFCFPPHVRQMRIFYCLRIVQNDLFERVQIFRAQPQSDTHLQAIDGFSMV